MLIYLYYQLEVVDNIVYDKFLNDNQSNSPENNNQNNSETKNDSSDSQNENLEQNFQQMISKKESCIDEFGKEDIACVKIYFENQCRENLKGNFCKIFEIGYASKDDKYKNDGQYALYFVKNDSLYLGEFATGKLHEINTIKEVSIKVIISYYSSDNSYPVVAVLAREGNGYSASTNLEKSSNTLNEIMDFIKIEANEKINDIIFLQNYEFMKREEHIMMTGRAIPFVKFG